MGFKNYDASQVTLIFMGLPITSGYADGDFVSVEQLDDDYKIVVGTDGEVTRSATNNKAATIKLMLMQSSDGNAVMSTVNNLDKSTPGGAGVGPMVIQDKLGTSIYTASKCWISKPPDVKLGREAQDREWTMQCADLKRFDGGN